MARMAGIDLLVVRFGTRFQHFIGDPRVRVERLDRGPQKTGTSECVSTSRRLSKLGWSYTN
jgi:hypothetical protein